LVIAFIAVTDAIIPYLLEIGSTVTFVARNLLYALLTGLFTSILPQSSKGTAIGIFLAVYETGECIGQTILSTLVQSDLLFDSRTCVHSPPLLVFLLLLCFCVAES